ncbi:TBC1 domain family member 13 [Homalodisca vitripennis]|uniref:TBC1 domain family member 13 n=1 Tax=Homalodisca vitripennis TaxID=197043 RepID=UPI001EEA683F|nr:TBC1 domain family member 13 [Homalodisca vitripennis]
MTSYRAKLKDFEELLNGEEINMTTLRTLCFSGCPDEGGHRAVCWKLLLNYLPPNRTLWCEVLAEKRELYSQFIDEMIVNPGECGVEGDCTFADHPLNVSPDSRWQTYFKDNEVLLQIDKDVRRLCPDISGPALPACITRLHYQSALSVCPTSLHYQYALPACTISLPYQFALPACPTSLHYQLALTAFTTRLPNQPALPACTTSLPNRPALPACTNSLPYQPALPASTTNLPYQENNFFPYYLNY